MSDKLTPTARSWNMSRIRAKDTGPELLVRKYLYRHGMRYRLHGKNLPGRPDIVFPGSRVCVFVHGCFWHGCLRCVDGTRRVASNVEYWRGKVAANQSRFEKQRASLRAEGWKAVVIWECQAQNTTKLRQLLKLIRMRRTALLRSDHTRNVTNKKNR